MSCIISIYHHIIHNMFAYVWHWCSFLRFALQINSYERETCFWRRKRETLCALLFEFPWGECSVSVPWPICQMLPKQWAIYLLLHLSTLLRFGWYCEINQNKVNSQKAVWHTTITVHQRASGMILVFFKCNSYVYKLEFPDIIIKEKYLLKE